MMVMYLIGFQYLEEIYLPVFIFNSGALKAMEHVAESLQPSVVNDFLGRGGKISFKIFPAPSQKNHSRQNPY